MLFPPTEKDAPQLGRGACPSEKISCLDSPRGCRHCQSLRRVAFAVPFFSGRTICAQVSIKITPM